ncbi:MAG: adenine phosphoribosyltransferase [Chitinophagales bacterium]
MIEQKLKNLIRDIPDFPKEGIVFKDITPLLLDPVVCREIVDAFIEQLDEEVDVVCAVESRGFFFGPMLAARLDVPFIPIRKKGKLPGTTISYSYDLEYGSATIEMHNGVLKPGQKVLLHDDLIATGGTVMASIELIKRQRAEVVAAAFLVSLEFLDGVKQIRNQVPHIISLAPYA